MGVSGKLRTKAGNISWAALYQSLKMNNIKSIINQEFKKFPEIEIVILFGSALKGKLASKSDIDIAFAAKTGISHEKK